MTVSTAFSPLEQTIYYPRPSSLPSWAFPVILWAPPGGPPIKRSCGDAFNRQGYLLRPSLKWASVPTLTALPTKYRHLGWLNLVDSMGSRGNHATDHTRKEKTKKPKFPKYPVTPENESCSWPMPRRRMTYVRKLVGILIHWPMRPNRSHLNTSTIKKSESGKNGMRILSARFNLPMPFYFSSAVNILRNHIAERKLP